MDKIQAMQMFVRVAEMESFTRAAESSGLPKGSVSRQIQALENLAGTQLLQRTTRRVRLTEDGEAYYQRCLELLSMHDELDTLFRHEPASLSGTLRVDMSVAIAAGYVLPRLPEFLQRYPGLAVELSSSDSLTDMVRDGLDCVLRTGELADSGLVARHVGQHTLVNCASPQYLARFGIPQRPEELTQHALVHYRSQPGRSAPGFEYFDGKETRIYPAGGAVTVNSTETYRAACLAGLGIIQVPLAGVRTLLEQGQLQTILEDFPARPMPVSLLYPRRKNIPRRVRVFMDWLVQILQEYVR